MMEFSGISHYGAAEANGTSDMIMYSENGEIYTDENGLDQYAEPYSTDNEFIESQTILADGGDRFGVSAVSFDMHEELLWMGNQGGHVTSYFGSGAQKYTSFQVHSSEEVRHILTGEAGILALTSSSLRGQIRRGIPMFTHCSENMVEMQCMLQTSPTSLLMGGHQDKLIQFDLTQGIETGLFDAGENGCAILRQHPRYLCSGDPSGRIVLRDPNSLSVEHVLETHSGSLSDFDVHGNLLISCGFSNRQGALSVDRFLMVYDLRMMRLVNPIPVVLDPLLLRFMPSFTSRVAVVSSLGQLQLADTVSLQTPNLSLYQVNTAGSLCLSLDVSSSCQCLAIGDSGGYFHIFTPTNSETAMINTFSRETEFADQIDLPPSISIKDESTSLAGIPLPYAPHESKLLSDWPEQCLKKVYRPTPPIDPDILRSMKMQGTIGYAPNPMTRRRNQVLYELDMKRRNGFVNGSGPAGGEGRPKTGEETGFIAIPKRYRKVEVKYSRMGMDDFDFDIYNNTSFSGLEASLPNSYCNAMLQILYFLEPIRCVLLSHICQREFCLSCELGFLFHMLDTSHGFPCQAANFQRAFRTVPEAYALGLLLSDQNPESKSNLIRLIQSWNRFILHQMHYELLEVKKHQNEILKEKQLREQKELQDAQAPFVYNEQEFPSISNPVISNNVQWRLQPGSTKDVPNPNDVIAGGAAQSQFWETDPYFYGYQDESRYWWLPSGTTYYSHYQDASMPNGSIPSQSIRHAMDDLSEVTKAKEKEDDTTEISHLLGSKQIHTHRCLKCGRQVSKESVMLLCNLVYPEMKEGVQHTFGQVLGQSLCPEQVTPAWCDACDRFQPTKQSRGLKQLPCILSINCGLDNPKDKAFWQMQMDLIVKKVIEMTGGEVETATPAAPQPSPTKACRYGTACNRPNCRFRHPGQNSEKETQQSKTTANAQFYSTTSWLPLSISMERLSNGSVRAYNINESSEKPTDLGEEVVQASVYDLMAVVCHVNDEKKNLVSLVNVGSSYHSRLGGAPLSNWYLFNDFCITPVNAQEAIWFSLDWKVPCVLYWVNRDLPQDLVPPVNNPLTAEVFSEDNSLARNNGARKITFTPLLVDEMLAPGELVAVDAEFVTLNQEESELRSDGKVSTVKPSHKSVARITCVRGQGPREGTPFIDDYISTQEQVVDYLTKFSGIKPGDLDANFSSKHLTTLKSTYQKLRFLVDTGVKFVGHGLKNDFRVINLVVPPEQVIDTVLLFHLPNHRLISLRFLAWHFLGMKIQSVTHDSVEDARAALQLYKKYKEIDAQGKLKDTLIDLYRVGNQHQWKVPGVDD